MLWNIVCALLTGDPVTRGQLSRLISSISVNNFPLAFTIMKLKSRIPRYGTLRHTLHRHLSTSQNKHSDLACSSHVYTRMQQDFSRVNINVKMMIVVPWNKTAQVSGVVFLLPDGELRQSSLCWSCSS